MPASPPVESKASQVLPPIELPGVLYAAKNTIIIDLREAIRKYNFLLPTFQLQKKSNRLYILDKTGAALLDRMAILILSYLASKPPASRKASGQQKWHGAAALIQQLHAHALHFNLKLLHGDFTGDDNYWLERFDPVHGDLGEWWDFENWMKETGKTQFLRSGPAGQLKYLNQVEREKYRVDRDGSRVCYTHDQSLLDTRNGEGTLSGLPNSFIYVCSALTRNIYTDESKGRVMHHSSFLRGEPVIAAGDWVVLDGEVRIVNGQSGHYRTTFENMRAFALAGQRFWTARTLFAPWFDRSRDYVLARNLIELGAAAPVLKWNDARIPEVLAHVERPSQPQVNPDRSAYVN